MSDSSNRVDQEHIASTAIERYLGSTRHGSGMVFDAKLRLRGPLNLDQLQAAWRQTVEKTPQLFSAWCGQRQNARWKRSAFDPSRFEVRTIDHLDRRKLINDLRPDLGVSAKLVVAKPLAERDFYLWFLFHHVGCDGVGGVRLVSKTLQNYTHKLDASSSVAVEAAPSIQSERITATTLPDPRNVWSTIRGRNVRIDSRHAAPPARSGLFAEVAAGSEHLSSARTPTHERVTCSLEFSRRLRVLLGSQQMTLNDLAVSVTLFSLAETHGGRSRKYVNVMNPVQTRTWDQRRDTRNHIGFAFIRRRACELESLAETTQSVSDELTNIRSASIANELGAGLALFERIPGALGLIEKLGWFCPTASVTCLTSLKFGKRHGMSRRLVKSHACEGEDIPERQHAPRSSFVADAEVKDVELVGPMQVGVKLAITMWDSPEGISVTFRHSDEGTQPACHEIAQRWCKNFSALVPS